MMEDDYSGYAEEEKERRIASEVIKQLTERGLVQGSGGCGMMDRKDHIGTHMDSSADSGVPVYVGSKIVYREGSRLEIYAGVNEFVSKLENFAQQIKRTRSPERLVMLVERVWDCVSNFYAEVSDDDQESAAVDDLE
jgi:hypothetical protein